MTKILTTSDYRVWWLSVMGFALSLSLPRGQWYAHDRATTNTAGMFASSGGCSEFLKRTDVNVRKYGRHIAAAWRRSQEQVLSQGRFSDRRRSYVRKNWTSKFHRQTG